MNIQIIKPVRKQQWDEYKQKVIKEKAHKMIVLEDLVQSEPFGEYMQLLESAINEITRSILTDVSKEQVEPIHSLKEVKILVRNELVKLRKYPEATLKLLSTNIDKFGSTQ